MKTENRRPGLDLIRCLAMLFVITYHFFLHCGFHLAPQTGFAMWVAGCFRSLSTSCIGLFLMLTGYLKSTKTDFRSCYRCLLPLLLAYLLASAVSIPVQHFFLHSPKSLLDWIKRLVQFTAVHYGWYVEMYLGLVLLIPFINLLLRQLNDRGLLVLSAVLLLLTAMPGALPWNIFPDYWRSLFSITYYVLGAAIHRHQPKLAPWAGIAGAAALAMLLGTVTFLSTDTALYSGVYWEFPDLWTMLLSVLLFVGLYRISIGGAAGKLLAFGSMGCYGACLLSHLFDSWCYKLLPQWHTPERYFLLFLCVTVPIYLVSLGLGNLLQVLTKFLSAKVTGLLIPMKQKTT